MIAKKTKGAQPGNQNAAGRRKAEIAKRTNIRLYAKHQQLAKALAAHLGISQSEVHRRAIEEMATRLKLS